MIAYEYDNLPKSMEWVKPIPGELFQDGWGAIKQAVESDQCLAHEIRAAYVYDRKQEMSFDQFGADRNASYGSESDDVVLQLTVRMPNPNPKFWGGPDVCTLTHNLAESVREVTVEQKRKKLEAELAEADRIAAQKRAELEALAG